MRAVFIAMLLVAAGAAGCLGSDDASTSDDGRDEDESPPVDAAWADQALPHNEEHDHTNRAHHQNLSTPNFETLGYDPLTTDYHGETSGDYFCGETASEGERDLAVTNGFNNDVAFVLVDVTDPANPAKVSEFVLPYSHTYDVAMTPDGAYVAVAISGTDDGPDEGIGTEQTQPSAYPASPDASDEDACGGQTVAQETDETPYQSGVVLVDISDPESPEVAAYRTQAVYGPHSIFATTIDGEYHILASTTNLQHQTSYFTFFGIEETPLGAQLVERGEHTAQQPEASWQGTQPPLTNGHIDGWIQKHPETGQTIGYLANWNGGFQLVEITDTGVEQIGSWNDYDAEAGAGMTGQIHGTLPLSETWNDTHYTFIGQEVISRPAERPTGQVIMMDTTDPADPQPVARWTLPADVEFDDSLQFSTHYFALVDQTLFVAMYHGGVWAVDVSPEAGPELPTLGVFVPDQQSPAPPDPDRLYADWAPTVLDVLALPSGDLVSFDGTSGVYTLSFDPEMSIPSPEPWTADAWIGNETDEDEGPLPLGVDS